VAYLKNLGMTVTNQNNVHDESKSELNLGNAFSYAVENLLPKNLKTEIYKAVI
jgi:hypothetical protein